MKRPLINILVPLLVSSVAVAAALAAAVSPISSASALSTPAVSASGWEATNPPANAVDGQLSTRWAASGDAWLQLDLGSPQRVEAVRIAWHRGDLRKATFDVQVSVDGVTFQTLHSGTSSGTTAALEAVDVADTVARHVRVVGHGTTESTWNSISELVVDAQIAPLPIAAVAASGFEAGNPPAAAIDTDLATRWSALGDGQWLQVDLGGPASIAHVRTAWHRGTERTTSFTLLTSTDGVTWTPVFDGKSSGTTAALEPVDFPDVTARYLRLVGHGSTASAWNSVSELELRSDPVAPAAKTVRVAVAGDIAPSGGKQQATANLITAGNFDAVLTLGDNVYESGTPAEFSSYYAPSWGAFLGKTYPVPGNHEYNSGATGYFGYFKSRACPTNPAACAPSVGYYSFDIGDWHVVALNSNCSQVAGGGCAAGSTQEKWLRADLAASTKKCTLATWHHPRWSSGAHGNYTTVAPLLKALHDHKAELVFTGHDHEYERFAPMTPTGAADPAGIRQFVVGTGGTALRAFSSIQPNSEARNSSAHGVLALTLRPDGYDWDFLPIAGKAYVDRGTGTCR